MSEVVREIEIIPESKDKFVWKKDEIIVKKAGQEAKREPKTENAGYIKKH